MYTRYYDGYTERNTSNIQQIKEEKEENIVAEVEPKEEESQVASLPVNLPFNMQADDLILIAVLFLIASESKDEFILPLILGYLLLNA